MRKITIGIIGAGNMGEALIRGLRQKKQYRLCVHDKRTTRLNSITRRYAVKKNTLKQLTKTSNIIIICVKPQDMGAVLFDLKAYVQARHTVISIAAGITTAYIEKLLPGSTKVVRVMPNMPGLISEGISVYCLGRHAHKGAAGTTERIFSAIGRTLKIREKDMDAVTATSGSGPGFIAYLAECLTAGARAAGLDKKTARTLVLATLEGTASLLAQARLSPLELVKKVASPGGTTEAGLRVLKEKKVAAVLKQALEAATRRAKELRQSR